MSTFSLYLKVEAGPSLKHGCVVLETLIFAALLHSGHHSSHFVDEETEVKTEVRKPAEAAQGES